MSVQRVSPEENPPQTGGWIHSLGDVFLGLSREGVIRRVIGAVAIPSELNILQVQGLTWPAFVEHFSDPAAQAGLLTLWQAVAEGAVAPAHWPLMVPFKPGLTARLRPVDGDPIVAFAAHLGPAAQAQLDALLSSTLHDTLRRLVGLSQSISRGVQGPLTDSQVRAIGAIHAASENASQLLESLRYAFTAPAVSVPLPHAARTLLTFSPADFTGIRRTKTHQLHISAEIPPELYVYCHPALREVVRHTLEVLLAGITAQTTITLGLEDGVEPGTAKLMISYHTQEPGLLCVGRLEPTPWHTAHLTQPTTALQHLVNALQACLHPVTGSAWAEPGSDASGTMQLRAVLPRWTPPVPR